MATRTIEGLDGVIKALTETPKEARAILRDDVRTTIRRGAQLTRQNAPFETGALREAIAEDPPKGRGLIGYVSVRPGQFRGRTPSAYVIPLEYGKSPGARPFIRSTAEQMTAQFIAMVKASGRTLEQNLENVGGRFL